MKKLFFFICFLLILVGPGINFTNYLSQIKHFSFIQKQTISIHNNFKKDLSNNETYLVSDADDDINDAERKFIPSSQKNSTNIISYLKEFHNPKLPKKFISNKNYFYLKNTLFIFISVFRI